ncbi:Macrolide export ATP-binding/permease protein MacB [Corynebacterium capitovis DSM 44611]|uniref:ABC transporter permease n=1 Tax=Corynebacterium capitovis TaxID=131081 RepID=UPI00035E0FD8|nr:ABC transporter permease [Corynebacterium capitovis]WKD57386.1 Macrolide export ATP-binding/permease protein MacB [Corynebacterium capitovis DSM 44611]
MNLAESLRLAASSFRTNKLRSLLTLLGIIIGIMAVIIIMTLGAGLQKQTVASLEGVGASNHIVTIHERTEDTGTSDDPFASLDLAPPTDERDLVSLADLDTLRSHFGSRVQGVDVGDSASIEAEALYDDTTASTSVYPVLADSLGMRNLAVEYGRGLRSNDLDQQRPVAVVSSKLVEALFNSDAQRALGSRVDLTSNGRTAVFTIVGVLEEEKKSSLMSGVRTYADAYIPLTSAGMLGNTIAGVSSFSVQTSAEVDHAAFKDELQAYINRWYSHNDKFEAEVLDLSKSFEELNKVFAIVSSVLSAIGGISLLVGGIGVMNIMLITVTERTREIGVRKALGATHNDIRTQFIVEAVLVCLVGGVIGIILGTAIGMAATASFDALATPPLGAVLFSLAFSLATGVFFGAYPASKAAKMQPIDALRYE